MSVCAASWAFEQDLPCAHKFVLVALGDSCGAENSCWPSQKTLAFKTGLSRSRVNVILGELEEQGYLTFELRKRPDGSDTSCKYTLNVPDTPASMKDVRNTVMGDVYVVFSENLTKVGISRQSERRIKGLVSAIGRDVTVKQTWTLPMPQVRLVEKAAHEALAEFRTSGEWFTCSPEQAVVAVIEAITVSCGKTPPVASEDTGCSTGGHPPVLQQDTNEPSRLNQVYESFSLREKAPPQPRRKPMRSIPEGFPSQESKDWAQDHWLKKGRVDLCTLMEDEVSKFRDYHLANPKGSADWPASWRTWCKNAMNFAKQYRNGGGNERLSAHEKFARAAFDLAGGQSGEDRPRNGGVDPPERPLLASRHD